MQLGFLLIRRIIIHVQTYGHINLLLWQCNIRAFAREIVNSHAIATSFKLTNKINFTAIGCETAVLWNGGSNWSFQSIHQSRSIRSIYPTVAQLCISREVRQKYHERTNERRISKEFYLQQLFILFTGLIYSHRVLVNGARWLVEMGEDPWRQTCDLK